MAAAVGSRASAATAGALPSPVVAAPSPVIPAVSTSGPDLKYLSFFRAAVIKFYIFLVQVYEHLKDKAGSLKPGIESVEATVKSVVGPVVSRVEFDPDEYLKFVDTKVDSTIIFASEHTPVEWKTRAETVYEYASKSSEKVHSAVEEYKERGAAATFQSSYEFLLPYAAAYLEALWRVLLSLPLVPQAVDVSRPYVFYAAQQYNNWLAEAQKSELPVLKTVSSHLPAVPVEKLKKAE